MDRVQRDAPFALSGGLSVARQALLTGALSDYYVGHVDCSLHRGLRGANLVCTREQLTSWLCETWHPFVLVLPETAGCVGGLYPGLRDWLTVAVSWSRPCFLNV